MKIVQQLIAPVSQLPAANRLSVADMAVPALKRLSPAQYGAFRQIVNALTAAGGNLDLFEYCLRVVLFASLDVQFGLRPAAAVRYKSVAAVAQTAAVVLSALAYAGQSQPDDIQRAFQAGGARSLARPRSSRRSNARSTVSTRPWVSLPKRRRR